MHISHSQRSYVLHKKCTNVLKFGRFLHGKNASSHKKWKAKLIANSNDRTKTDDIGREFVILWFYNRLKWPEFIY